MIRRRECANILIAALLFGASGCTPMKMVETISTAQTCQEVNEIVTDMSNVLVQIAVNPLAAEVYIARLRELTGELRELRPLDDELENNLADVATGAEKILAATDLSAPANLLQLPNGIAEAQVSLGKVLAKCEELVSA